MVNRCDKFDRHGRRCLRSWHLAGLHVYSLPNKLGARRAREHVELALFREAVKERADGMCETRGLVRANAGYVCGIKPHPGCDPHHLEPNDRDLGVHDPDRAIWTCRRAHDFIHANPEEAHSLGLLRPWSEAK